MSKSFIFLLSIILVPWLMACAPERPLVVSIHPWIGYETLYLAHEFGWLPSGVRLHKVQNAGDSLTALQAGEVDAACLTLDEVLRARAAEVQLTIGLVFDVSAGADVVLVRSGIERLADLAGKRIGVERNALGALVLSKLLEATGLPASAVTTIDLPPDQQLAAWQRSDVDAVISYEPTATRLQHEGAQRLFDSRQIPDTIFDVLAVKNDRIAGQYASLKALVESHFRGLRHIQSNHQDALYRIAAHEGVSFDEVHRELASITQPSLVANQGYLTAPHTLLHQAARTISSLMVKQGLIAHEIPLDGLITSAWLPSE
ncbi:NitT/TauT family transport system substrate-binding protein [Gammaproteobacteria bacterium]